MKTTIQKVLIVLLIAVSVSVIAMSMYTMFRNPNDCSVGDDACIDRVTTALRKERDDKIAQVDLNIKNWTDIRLDTEKRSNDAINALKGKRTAASSASLLKKGQKEDVLPELLTFQSKFIPQALADNSQSQESVTYPSASSSVKTIASSEMSDTFKKIMVTLQRKNAPFKDVDLWSIAKKTGVTDDQALTLVAIVGHESQFGNSFARSEGNRVIAASKEEGISYHNYAGVKRCITVPVDSNASPETIDYTTPCPEASKIPDGRGFWLQKYESDEQFFATYFAQMKKGYFDKGCSEPACVMQWYVGGSVSKKWGWADAVYSIRDSISANKI